MPARVPHAPRTGRAALAAAVVAAALVFSARSVGASDPTGVFGVIQKVTMMPDEAHATAVQVHGAFAIAPSGMIDYSNWPSSYSKPRLGYLYYVAPKGQEAVCLKEWSDLKVVAGTKTVVGLGSRSTVSRLLRKTAGGS